MKKNDLISYKEKLLFLRSRLRGDVTAMASAALRKSGMEGTLGSAMPIHMAEQGSENFDQEFTLSVMQAEEGTLELIESALDRIENGAYGQCTRCEGVVAKQRLNAVPYTPVCIRCAEQLEDSALPRQPK